MPKSVVGNWIRNSEVVPCIKAVKMGGTKEEHESYCGRPSTRSRDGQKHKFDVL
jgi:hypothetical protein